MSFNYAIKNILNELQISDDDRADYVNDAIAIQNYVIERLKSEDPTFRSAYDGLSLGGSYLDRVKLLTPDEFDLHMKLKFPFDVVPKKNENAFVLLYAPGGRNSRLVSDDGYIYREVLQGWLRGIFHKVFNSSLRLTCFGRTYTTKYTAGGYGCAHSIEARCGDRTISFDLVPAFEFHGSQWPLDVAPVPSQVRSQYSWFAIPQKKSGSNDDRTFMVCAPHWEREVMKGSYNLKNVLRLMKGLRDANDLPHLSSYMLKSVILQQLSNVNWQRDEALLLVEMWQQLVYHLRCGTLPFFLANGHNIFDRMGGSDLATCQINAIEILRKLKIYHMNDNGNGLRQLFN
ncbi:uncharacterized protein LOC122617406 [Drosophila teissieri]|uniref:uncharacterized protein LOC122617406 n=1 Tax=Drosophila teissieri TaxID=7243 RepID=UPI001CBA5715|nr:uncharacterized protein LOC122617406 [Drosophila teissieri]